MSHLWGRSNFSVLGALLFIVSPLNGLSHFFCPFFVTKKAGHNTVNEHLLENHVDACFLCVCVYFFLEHLDTLLISFPVFWTGSCPLASCFASLCFCVRFFRPLFLILRLQFFGLAIFFCWHEATGPSSHYSILNGVYNLRVRSMQQSSILRAGGLLPVLPIHLCGEQIRSQVSSVIMVTRINV